MDGFCPKPINLAVLRTLVDEHCLDVAPTTESHPGVALGGSSSGGGGGGRLSSKRLSSGGSTTSTSTRDAAASRRKEQSLEETSLLGNNLAGVEEGDRPGAHEEEAMHKVCLLYTSDAADE